MSACSSASVIVLCAYTLFVLQAMDKLMPGFDGEIAKLAQRVLVNPRHIDWHTGVLATKVTPGTSPHVVTHLQLKLLAYCLFIPCIPGQFPTTVRFQNIGAHESDFRLDRQSVASGVVSKTCKHNSSSAMLFVFCLYDFLLASVAP